MKEFYQISYPRSGSHLVRSCARMLLDMVELPIHTVDSIADTYVRMHFFPDWIEPHRDLIFLLRNPLDVLVRQENITDEDVESGKFKEHLDPNPDKPKERYWYRLTTIDYSYIGLIQGYLKWENNKTLYYYEDIITDFKNFVEDLGYTLDAKQDRIDYISKYYEDMFYINLVKYDAVDTSVTYGNPDIKHRDKLSKESKQTIIDHIYENYPNESQVLARYLNE